MLKRALSLCVVLSVFAGMAAGQSGPSPSLSFIDRWGDDAPQLVEYDLARIRLTDPSLDVSGERNTVNVNVSSVLGTDTETVTLTETGKRTGVFEGGIDLRINGGSPAFPGILETMGPSGAFDSIQVDANGGLSDTAQVVPSILFIVDDQGDETPAVAAGGRVFVRLIDRLSDTPNPDATTVILTTSGGDSEVVVLAETAASGGEFTGSIASRLATGTPTPGDGALDALAGETLSASHEDVNNVTSSSDTAPFAGITLRFVDSRGVPTSTCFEGRKIILQAISAGANLDPLVVEEIPATLTSQIAGDSEAVPLIETGTSTGVFEGQRRVTGYTPVVPGNTHIQVSPSFPVPETIEASAPGAASITIHPSGSSTRLLDVWGNDAETFPRGGTLRVRVEDHMIDTPYYSLQSTGVRLLSLTTGDEEILALDETGLGSNVYEGSLSLEIGPAIPGDGKLQAQADGEILEARHDDWNGVTVSTDTGRLSPAEMWFLDDDGRPAETVLENGTLRLRLFDFLQSTPPTADVASEVAGDGENFYFSAVPESPGSFEGSMPTEHMTWGTPTGNGVLATRYDDNSLDGLDTIRAFALNTSTSARAAFSELHFVDSHGNEAESFAIGETLHVRLRSRAFGTPGADQVQILLLSQTTGDSETMTLTETGPETGIYEGSFPTGTGTASIADGRLQVRIGETVAAEDNRADRPIAFVLDTAVITASRVTFVDRQNVPTGVVFRNGRARVEAFDLAANTDPGAIESRSVTILSYADSNGRLFDLETLDLIETGPGTALFRGSIRVSSETGSTFGVLDTSFYSPYEGSSHWLRVEILGGSSDRAELTDAAVRFLDGQGNDASIYQAGDTVRIRLIREASNLSPAIVDTASVYLYSWIGRAATSQSNDMLLLNLTETGPDTDVFEGEIEATAAPPNTDSIFQVHPGGEIQALIAGTWTEDADRAFISDGGVTPENYPPVALDDSATVDEVSSVEIDVLANDSDPNGDSFSIVSYTQGTKGSVSASGAGLLYTPNAGLTGADSFTYTIEDPSGATSTATVWMTITEVNNPPVAVADNITLPEDTPLAFSLHANDYDPDGDALTISASTNGSHGSTIRFSHSVFYSPNANWFGTDTFTYTVSDGKGGTAAGTVFVTVTPVNDAPTAVNDNLVINEDTPVTVNVLANDSDVEGNPLTVTSATQGNKGAVTVNAGATVTYTPNLNATGPDSFTYTVSDGQGGTKTATVWISISSVNDAPNAVNDARTTPEGTAVNIAVLANDSDPEGQTLTVTAVTQGANGSVVLNADKTVTYTPTGSFSGSDSFTYTISDGSLTATASVAITVTPANYPPHAVEDQATVAEDGTVTINVLANDSDPNGDPLSVPSVLPATNGVARRNGDFTVTYTPKPDFHGQDFFVYTVSDPGSAKNSATVLITVTPVDDAPVAVADAATVAEDAPATAVNVLANDTDVDGGPKSIDSVTQPANGAVVITGGGTGLTYQPNANYCNNPPGTTLDTFTYTLAPGGSTATVTVTVTCSDDAPTAVDDAATVNEDSGANTINVQANDTDTDGGSNTVSSLTQPANGTVAITNGGADLTYTPNANFCDTPDIFIYTLSPGGSTATVTVTVTCVDDSPVAVMDAATVNEDSGASSINVLANDTDIDAGPISIAAVIQPANGTVVITNGGTDLTYAPNANFCGTPDPFNYTLSPGGSTATVTITVTCVNDAPIVDLDANDDQGTAGNDFAVTFTEGETAKLIEDPLDATLTDVDSAILVSLTVTITNLLDLGSETLSADVTGTSITADYVPATGVLTLTGPDTLANFQTVLRKVTYLNTDLDSDATPRVIHFVANDGSADGNTAASTVTVVPVDTPPTAVDDAATVNEDSAANAIDVLANDTDVDGGPISISAVTQPANGTVVITGGGTGLTYQPNANFCGTLDTFTYTLTPGGSTATVTVTVTCVDDNPVAVADAATVVEDSGANTINVLANDTDVDGGAISISAVTQPANGSVVITGGGTGLTYQPNANFCNTPDTFSYTLSPGGSTATVTVTVTCVDDNPVAVADAATVVEDSGANAINVLANDTDVDGGPISITSVTQPAHGTVTITGGGTGLTYTPNANFCNTPETFTYTLSPGGSTATVTVTVTCVDDNPVAVADAATVVEDSGANAINVLANDTDVDGGPISITSVTQPANGTVVITGGGTGLTYQPNANFCGTPNTFTYTLAPGGSTATVTVTVTCTNDAPDAVNDVAATAEDTVVTLSVLANDTDVDGNPLQVTAVTQGTKGAVTINANNTVTYTPALNTNGADAFTYTISDGNGGSDTATVTVSVAAVNDAPVAAADTATTREGAAVTVSVLANDSDVEGNTLTVTSVTTPAGGTAAVNGNNTVTYTPDANFNGTDSFTCTISDGQGGTATATVTVTVTDALERVAVLATHGVWIQTGADVLSGDVIVNQTGSAPFLTGSVELTVAGTVTTPAGYDIQANRINVASGATVASDVYYNQLTGTVTGPQTSPLALPVFATLPSFLTATPGATDVNVGTNGTRTLAAGSYRDLIVGRKGTVTFTGGTYHFRTVQIDREARLFFSAASTVRVQQKLTALQTTWIRPAAGATIDGSDIVIHVGGGNGTGGGLTETPKAVELGVDNVIWANVYAPNGTIWMKDRTQVRGVLLGKDVQLGPDVQVTLDSSFTGQ